MDKLERIKEERQKLDELFSKLPENKYRLVCPLLDNAAFMKVTLDDLQVSINAGGCSEEYQNGENQRGRKASADLQAYNSTMKIYNSLMDRLDKMLPADSGKSKLEEMMAE